MNRETRRRLERTTGGKVIALGDGRPADPKAVEIELPPQPGSPGGQLLLDVPGIFFNFEVDAEAGESVDGMADRLAAFLADDRAGECFPFVSPFDGQTHYLTRAGAARVVAICHTRDQGTRVKPTPGSGLSVVRDGKILRA